jgi:predicted nucleic acid-binding protein
VLYLDSSALAKLYVVEPESPSVDRMVSAAKPWIATSRVTYAEVLSVLVRCLRDHRLSPAMYKAQKKAFFADWDSIHVIELTRAVLSEAGRLIESHTLRGFDAIHLCSALWTGNPSFACFDDRLRNAAKAEGLTLAV